MKRLASTFTLLLLLCSALILLSETRTVQANETIYIRADGNVEPSSAPIQRVGNTYAFTGDIYEPIVVERDNVVVDGARYALQGTGSGTGINLTSRSNVTIKNVEINGFGTGIHLAGSSNNFISENNFINNGDGVCIRDLWLGDHGVGSSNNIVTGNNIAANSRYGVQIIRWSEQNIVSGNSITSNGHGIYVSDFANNTIIVDNNVTLNEEYGIHIDYYSCNNLIKENHVANNTVGIRLYRSINNTLRNNRMNNNKYNFEVWYIFVSHFINDIDTSNTVNGKPIYHWIGERDKTVPSDAGYVALINCVGITVQNLNLANNKDGILVISTKISKITRNNIENCDVGIYLDHSSAGVAMTSLGPPSSGIVICENNIMNNVYGIHLDDAYENTIYRNNIINNSAGIYFAASENNEIYHNNFINNTDQVKFNGFWMPPFAPARLNTWDNGYPSGGNYWSDYKEKYSNATELDGSGIWNTPYILAESNQDNRPLVNRVVIPEFPNEGEPTTPPREPPTDAPASPSPQPENSKAPPLDMSVAAGTAAAIIAIIAIAAVILKKRSK